MFLPIRTDSPLRSTPWANWTLIALNIGVFLLGSVDPLFFSRWALFPPAPRLHEFITYAFCHQDWVHLGGNMLFLYIFGNNICDRLGNLAYVAFYLSAAVFAGLGHTFFSTASVVGASGAVAGVTGAYLALLPSSRVTVIYWFYLIGLWEIPSLWFIGLYFVFDLVMSVAGGGGVAYTAHLSGSVCGFLVCMLLLKWHLLPRNHTDMLSLADRWNRRRQYQALVKEGYDPFSYVRPKSETPAPAPPPLPGEFDRQQQQLAEISEQIAQGDPKAAAELYRQLRQRDPNQTLSRGVQLDIANQFYAEGDYPNAAEAYELYLRSYRNSEQAAQVCLMLGLVCSRYLHQRSKARENLLEAIRRLRNERDLELAKAELLALDHPKA